MRGQRVMHRSASCLFVFVGCLLSACSGGGAANDGGLPDMPNGEDLGIDPDGGGSDGGIISTSCPGVPISQTGGLNVNLLSVELSGSVTLNGQPLPDATQYRGALLFTHQKSGATVSVSLKNTGAGAFQVTLAPGSYDVRFAANSNLCASSTNAIPCIASVNATSLSSYRPILWPGTYQIDYKPRGTSCNLGGLPCVSGPLVKTLPGAANFEVPTVTVTGQSLVNGAMITSTAGQVRFTLADAGGGSVGTASLGNYSVRLLRGTYDIDYQPLLAQCPAGQNVPCVSGRLRSRQVIDTTGALDLDIPMITLSGQVTLMSNPMANSDGNRGALEFVLAGSANAGTTEAFGSTGPVSYQMRLLPGAFVIRHKAQAARCTSGFSVGGIPCIDQLPAGCP